MAGKTGIRNRKPHIVADSVIRERIGYFPPRPKPVVENRVADTHVLPTIEIDDEVEVKAHMFDAGSYHPNGPKNFCGAAFLERRGGIYRVYHVFRNGNLFASLVGSGDPQVIEPKHILGKVEERRAA